METSKSLKLLIIDLKGHLLFCSIDATRIVFFENLPINEFAAKTDKVHQTSIEIQKNESVFWTGTVRYLFYAQQGGYQIDDFKKLSKDPKVYYEYCTEEVIKARFLSKGDIVTITKHDWNDEQNPLDIVAGEHTEPTYPSNKIVPDDFSEVFDMYLGTTEVIINAFKISEAELRNKKATIQRMIISE